MARVRYFVKNTIWSQAKYIDLLSNFLGFGFAKWGHSWKYWFRKASIYQPIVPKVLMFILGFCFLNIVWEFLEIDFRKKIRDFLNKNPSPNYFMLKIFQTIFLMSGRTARGQGSQGFYKQVDRLWAQDFLSKIQIVGLIPGWKIDF